jgi:hypothetical protein
VMVVVVEEEHRGGVILQKARERPTDLARP